jgi:hypothetical protein
MDGDADGEAAAGNLRQNRFPDAGFEHLEFAREIDRDFGLLAVHGTEFDGDIESVASALAAPVARH